MDFKVGAPRMYETAEELQDAISSYFANPPTKTIIKDGKSIEVPHVSITSLCFILGFESRQSFYDYEKKEGFTYTIKRARLCIESEYEFQLQKGNTTGAIFALKNFGWKDERQQDITSGGNPLTALISEISGNTFGPSSSNEDT